MSIRFIAFLAWVGLLIAQPPPAAYYENTNNIPVSPEIHPDRNVTFRLFAPKASEVVS